MTIEGTRIEPEPSSRRIARKDILARLKLETAPEHAGVEKATRVMSPELSLNGYREYLERTFGFYRILEEELLLAGVWDVLGLSAAARLKLPLLVRDLERLGADPSALPLCEAPPEFDSVVDAVGGAYVLEGSTLGGRVISRHVQRRLGAGVPRDFLECYGSHTGEHWQAFRGALLGFARSYELEERVVHGARETFRAFTRWLTRETSH